MTFAARAARRQAFRYGQQLQWLVRSPEDQDRIRAAYRTFIAQFVDDDVLLSYLDREMSDGVISVRSHS